MSTEILIIDDNPDIRNILNYLIKDAGYKTRVWAYDSTDPDYESTSVSGSLIPVAARIGIGTRFWFTDNIGANVDLGFGHSGLLNAGLSFKF